jgi:hypothetical protein
MAAGTPAASAAAAAAITRNFFMQPSLAADSSDPHKGR